MQKPRLGISSCLLGEPVRYDGQHQLNLFLRDELGAAVEWVPVCPEVECGLPVPREAMHLVGDPAHPRLMNNHTGQDLTRRMLDYCQKRVEALAGERLDGFVFKKGSPSSGLERVKIYSARGLAGKNGRGLFAAAFVARFPELPVIEDGMLQDRFLRERFLNRIFTAGRWHELLKTARTKQGLSEFQGRHKLMLMSHAPGRYAELGRLVETGDFEAYKRKLDELLALRPTLAKHVNVMQHILGYFKRDLESWEKQELLEAIADYRTGRAASAVPLTLLRHYARKYRKDYLLRQTYWELLGPYYL